MIPAESSPLVYRVALIALALLVLVVLANSFLFESVWLDEGISGWIASGTAAQAAERALRFQGQSPLYFLLLWLTVQIAGEAELVLRVPSLLCLMAACWFLYRLASLLLDRETGVFAVLLLLSSDGFQRSFSARPYALALLAAVAATYELARWRQAPPNQRWYYLAWMTVLFYAHYLFGVLLLLHFALLFVWRDHRGPKLTEFGMRTLLLALLWLPGIPQLWSLALRATQLSVVRGASFSDLLTTLVAPASAIAVAAGVLVALVVVPRTKLRVPLDTRDAAAVALWAGLPFLMAFLMSRAEEMSPSSRYLLWGAPGISLLFALILRALVPQRARLVGLLVASLLLLVRESGRDWQVEDWRAAAAYLGQHRDEEPVLVASGLIEAQSPEWLVAARYREYLTAPLQLYGVRSGVYPLPHLPHPAAREILESRLAGVSSAFLVLASGGREEPFERYQQLLSEEEFVIEEQERVPGLIVVGLRRAAEGDELRP